MRINGSRRPVRKFRPSIYAGVRERCADELTSKEGRSQRPLLAARYGPYFDSTAGFAAALAANAGVFIASSLLTFAAFGNRKE